MNILITGANGFIGRALTTQLINEGYEVYGVIRPDTDNREGLHEKLHLIECRLNESGQLLNCNLPGMDACVHLAWIGANKEDRDSEAIQKDNLENTMKLIETAGRLGCTRFLFAGSQAEYGVTEEKVLSGEESSEPYDETHSCNPVSMYGKTKLKVLHQGREAANRFGMTYIHLRIFSLYGKNERRKTLIPAAVDAFAAGGHMSFSKGTQLWNYLHVKDCAKAIADLINSVFIIDEDDPDESCVVNIASSDTRPLREFVEEIHSVIGKGDMDFDAKINNPEGTAFLNPDISKLCRITGFEEQMDFAKGIEEML